MQSREVSILIVDDERTVRSLLTQVLSSSFQCASVETASEALRLMDLQPFHLALVDLGLPGMSGLSLCRLIVNRNPGTIVIVVSGETDTASIEEAMKAGASGYITKPFELAEVVATVKRALERHLPGAVA